MKKITAISYKVVSFDVETGKKYTGHTVFDSKHIADMYALGMYQKNCGARYYEVRQVK